MCQLIRLTLGVFLLSQIVSGCSHDQYLPLAVKKVTSPKSQEAKIIETQVPITPTSRSSPSLSFPAMSSPTPIESSTRLHLPLLNKPGSSASLGWQLSPHTLQGSKAGVKYIMQLRYPIVEGADSFALDGFSRTIQSRVNMHADRFLEIVQEAAPDEPDGYLVSTYTILSEATEPDIEHHIDFQTTPAIIQAEQAITNYGQPVISILFHIDEYHGGVHPNEWHDSINYNLGTNQTLSLGDLFNPGSDYLAMIAKFCNAELHRRADLITNSIETGSAPLPVNYGIWNITPSGLLVTFEAYQVGPYSAGPQSVLVPYQALQEILRPDGPLGQFSQAGK